MLYNFDFGLATLSLIDDVIVIALVCDPVDRLEKAKRGSILVVL